MAPLHFWELPESKSMGFFSFLGNSKRRGKAEVRGLVQHTLTDPERRKMGCPFFFFSLCAKALNREKGKTSKQGGKIVIFPFNDFQVVLFH